MISILDLNLGNTKSLSNCFSYMGVKHSLINKASEIKKTDLLVIPGVGSFDYAMELLHKKKLTDIIIEHSIIKKKPIVGICIGMQIFFSSSDEGSKKGLGLFPYKLQKLKKNDEYKVPNVGFRKIHNFQNKGIFKDVEEDSNLYFTNSFGLKLKKTFDFDNYSMTRHKFNYLAGFQKNNIIGLQFHPELSHVSGMIILKNIYKNLF
tara:strand:- start:3830 stop:4447 length:618 start_codon:yes stop_codon:yes gene_type:complete